VGLAKLLLIIIGAGLLASLLRVVGGWIAQRPIRRYSGDRLQTTCAVGIPEGQALNVWIPRGARLPARCKRMVRVSSRTGPNVALSFHTDGSDLAPLLDVAIGPIDRSETNVRLIEVLLQVAADGRVRVKASVQTTKTALPVTVTGVRPGTREHVIIPTQPAPPEELDS
jgi:hypothetical protein